MGSLFETNDVITGPRLNRTAVMGRLGIPLYDVDDAEAVTVEGVYAGVALAATIGDVWAVPSGAAAAIVTGITICNTDSSARAVSLYLIEPGETAASVARTIFADTLQPGERISIRVPYFLDADAVIRGLAASANVVSVRVDALTFNEQPEGLTIQVVEGVALGNSLSTLYTCPSSGVTQAILLAVTFCNTDASSRTPQLHIVPDGDSAAVENQVWKDALVTKETVWLEDAAVLAPDDFIQAQASAAAVVSCRLTILEVA